MLASITPLGERGRARRWRVSAPSLAVGSLVGGLAVGALAGAVGALVLSVLDVATPVRLAVLAGAALLALAVDARPARSRAPGPRRQVNEQWLDVYREWVYGAGFGLQLGAAVLTQVATAAVYVMLLAAALTGSVSAGAAIGAVFGLVRALPVLATRRVHDASALGALHRRTAALAQPARAMTTTALAVATVLLGAGAAVTAGSGSA